MLDIDPNYIDAHYLRPTTPYGSTTSERKNTSRSLRRH
jgi:hypothetical protein